jgi:hypothetical protein
MSDLKARQRIGIKLTQFAAMDLEPKPLRAMLKRCDLGLRQTILG